MANFKYQEASRGLGYMFRAQVLMIIAFVVAAFTPLLAQFALASLILVIVALMLTMVGLSINSKTTSKFKTAFSFALIIFVIAFASAFFPAKIQIILQCAAHILGILITIFVINGATELCEEKGCKEAMFGKVTIVIYALSNISSVVFSLLETYKVINSPICTTIASVLSLIASIAYFIFLGKASAALKS